jgi:serine/threonine protein kinase/tetratricopeptide (TPR) repeat protein
VAGRFVIERATGHGGMGTVFCARDLHTGKLVALKLLHSGAAQPYERERFTREAELLADLRHPGIVGHVAHGHTEGGQPFLAMEWLDGEDLADRLARQKLSVKESMILVRRTAEALAVAHQHGVIHRDLKPSNLFLRDGRVERVTLLDFGIARQARRVSLATLTKTGSVVGTPAYMAPEQARGEREITASADVFSLGCVLFECLTGAPPFNAEHLVAQLVKTLFEEAPKLRSLRPDLPHSLDALLSRMLAKPPALRPRDATALLDELEIITDVPSTADIPDWAIATLPPDDALALAVSEQQFVSVIMAVESTALNLQETLHAREADEEDDRYQSLRAELTRRGADVERLADGSVVATMRKDAHHAATDQAAQAARCAVVVRERWPEASVALSTGRAVLGTSVPIGEAVDRAARLLAKNAGSDPGKDIEAIWIDEVTAGLLGSRFSVSRAPSGALILRGEQLSIDETRPLLGKPTPCVGREQEIGILEGMLASSIEEPTSCAVLVTAVPGIGKSRLRHEFLRRVAARGDGVVVLIGRGDPVLAGSPFGLLGSALRQLCGVLEGQDSSEQREFLAARISQHLPAPEIPRVVAALCEICGVAAGDEGGRARVTRDSGTLLEEAQPAFLDLLRAECARAPVLLVLEDLHWGDALTVKLTEAALRALSDQPFMVMALARPEVEELFPKLWAGLVQLMPLRALGKRASERLITQVLGGQIAPDVVSRIADRAGGNALYLEELVRAVAEGKGEELPDTVLAMVQARLSRLDPEARRVLRAASVFGNRFWRGGVHKLLGQDHRTGTVDRWLELLLDCEVIERHAESRIPGDVEYGFRHSLMREAAYGWLTENDRAIGHAAAGRFLRDGAEARHHYARALAALASMPDTAQNRRSRVDVTLKLIEISRAAQSPAHNLKLLTEAERQLQGIRPAECTDADRQQLSRVRYWIGTVYYYSNQPASATKYFRLVLDNDIGDEALIALPSAALGRMYAVQGHFGKAAQLLERSRSIVAKSGDWSEWSWTTSMLGMALSARGQCKEGLLAAQSAAARAEQTGNMTSVAAARGPLAAVYLFLGDMEGMTRACDSCAAAAEKSGDRIFIYMTRGIQIWAESRLGNHDKAAALLDLTKEIAQSFGRQLIATDWIGAATAEMALNRGSPAEAEKLAAEAVAFAASCGGVFASAMAHRVWAQAIAATSRERWDEVSAHMVESIEKFHVGECYIEAARTRYAWGVLAQAWGDADVARTQIEQAAGQLATSERTEELDAALRRLEELPPPGGLTRLIPAS